MPDTIGVACQKFARAKQVMRERGGLRRLRMRMRRHHRFQIPPARSSRTHRSPATAAASASSSRRAVIRYKVIAISFRLRPVCILPAMSAPTACSSSDSI